MKLFEEFKLFENMWDTKHDSGRDDNGLYSIEEVLTEGTSIEHPEKEKILRMFTDNGTVDLHICMFDDEQSPGDFEISAYGFLNDSEDFYLEPTELAGLIRSGYSHLRAMDHDDAETEFNKIVSYFSRYTNPGDSVPVELFMELCDEDSKRIFSINESKSLNRLSEEFKLYEDMWDGSAARRTRTHKRLSEGQLSFTDIFAARLEKDGSVICDACHQRFAPNDEMFNSVFNNVFGKNICDDCLDAYLDSAGNIEMFVNMAIDPDYTLPVEDPQEIQEIVDAWRNIRDSGKLKFSAEQLDKLEQAFFDNAESAGIVFEAAADINGVKVITIWDGNESDKQVLEFATFEEAAKHFDHVYVNAVEETYAEEVLYPVLDAMNNEEYDYIDDDGYAVYEQRVSTSVFESYELKETVIMTEGKYDYTHITNEKVIEVKGQIIDRLSKAGFNLPIRVQDDAYRKTKIVDFDILDGKIDIVVEKTHIDSYSKRTTTNIYTWDIKQAISETKALKANRAGAFIKALADIASEINLQLKPDIKTRRDNTVAGMLTPEIAEELRKHIRKIEYRIPLIDEHDFEIDKNNEPLTDGALRKLEKIFGDFFRLSFAETAREAGMVKNRSSSEDTNYNIEHSWRAVGTITFDCPIKNLSPEAQAVINAAKVKKADDTKIASDESNVASCYRLANAVIKHFDNNIFFNKPNVGLTESFRRTVSRGTTLVDNELFVDFD